MQNTGLDSGGGRITAEDVVSKLKDDGDYDRLRVKIIRKLKENEELRNNIISMVKQSAALNRPGAENMKPRQLSDAIHQEIGDKLMSQISDGLWNIIRSPDGMKAEIRETVKSVYDKLSNPCTKDNGDSSSHMDSLSIRHELENNRVATGAGTNEGTQSDGEPNEPPGFGLTDQHQRNNNNQMNQPNNIGLARDHNGQAIEENMHLKDLPEADNLDIGAPPGFSFVLKHKNSEDTSDEDPDVPPGFGAKLSFLIG